MQLQLWSTKTGERKVCFYHADKPVFTLDGEYLLYIDAGQTLIIYCLRVMAPMRYLACAADQLQALPVKHSSVLMTSWPSGTHAAPEVTVWDFVEERRTLSLKDVAAGGIQDISKDGLLAVDSDLRVFDLDTGSLVSHIDHHNPDSDKNLTFVRLTDDGRFVVWVDKLSVKVGRVSDSVLIAHAYTHERPTSLSMLDYGYILVVGTEDGRIIMMKLFPDCDQSHDALRPRTADERCVTMHGSQTCSKVVQAGFDAVYQCPCHAAKDSELPRAGESIRSTLTQRAKVPLLSTATCKTPDTAAEMCRRSPRTPIGDLHDGSLSAASSYHDIANSSERLDQFSPDRRSTESNDLMSGDDGSLMFRRSRSVTDMLAMCTLRQQAQCYTVDARSNPTAEPSPVSPPCRTPALKFLGSLWEFGSSFRSRRKKNRRRAAANRSTRDRMPSV